MDSRLVELIMRFRTELISDSTVYTISDWFHATFRAFSFENAKTVQFSSVQFSSVHILKFLYIQYLNKILITYNDYE